MYVHPQAGTNPPKILVALGKDIMGYEFEIKDFNDFLIMDELCQTPDPDDIISSPHSNSYLDLNGDCMPDIFLQKQKKIQVNTNLGTTTHYQNYYDIYIQKLDSQGMQKYCLMESKKTLIKQTSFTDPFTEVPLV